MSKRVFWIFPVAVAIMLLGAMFVSVRAIATGRMENFESEPGIHTVCPSGPPECQYAAIQDAVDIAKKDDLIKVAAGTYSDINNYGNHAQVVYLTKTITIRGGYTSPDFSEPPDPQTNLTVLDAQGNGRVFYLTNSDATIGGMTITGGNALGLGGTPYGDDAGGGMYLWESKPTIKDNVIVNNISPWDGGGIYMRMSSEPVLIGNTISNNIARHGGGIYSWYSYPEVIENRISKNTTDGSGGGVWLGVYSEAIFRNNQFFENSSNSFGGGITTDRCVILMEGNTFISNASLDESGGGVFLQTCDGDLLNNIFASNHAGINGDGLMISGSTVNIKHNTFAANTGTTGEGIHITNNSQPRFSEVYAYNNIIVGHKIGVSVSAGSAAEIEATLWGNDQWSNGVDWTGTGDISIGSLNIFGDPGFVSPENNDYHIGFTSNAIDAGMSSEITNDIDGDPRPYGEAPDLGADEYVPLLLEPADQSASGVPGEVVTYEVRLQNNTGVTDTFNLALSPSNWETNLSTDIISMLPTNVSQAFNVSVSIPSDAPWYQTDTVTITAASITNPTVYSTTSRVITEVYAPPQISVSPEVVSNTLYPNETDAQLMSIGNGNGVTLTYDIKNSDEIYGSVLLMHFDEPEGSTQFLDESGFANHGTCRGDSCPIAGVEGMLGTALQFDGVNDYVEIPHSAFMDSIEDEDKLSVAAWVNILEWYWGWFPILDKYEANNDHGWGYGLNSRGYFNLVFSPAPSADCYFYPILGEWVHLAASYDRDVGWIKYYVNGELACEYEYSEDFMDTDGEPLYVGFGPSGGDEYANGIIDEVSIFNRAISEEEIKLLYTGMDFNSADWMNVDPNSGTVATNSSENILMTFDSGGIQPDIYTTDLLIFSNDPVNPLVRVPVTMTVEPTASMGWVEGTITDLRQGYPMEATIIAEGQPYTVVSDPQDGSYKFWLEPGMYDLQISAPGYVSQVKNVKIYPQRALYMDFALLLDAPWLRYTPDSITSTQMVGDISAQTLMISNTGSSTMTFQIEPEETIRIVSDNSWRVSGTHIPGWEELYFDDSSWEFTVAKAPDDCDTTYCWEDSDALTMWSNVQHVTNYLRKEFYIGNIHNVISASIKTSCDDDHDLYINGILVASDWNGYAGPTLVTDMLPYLQSGKNIIAIKAHDTYGVCRAMCVDAEIIQTVSWISVDPKTGNVPPGASVQVQVDLSSEGIQPDDYATKLLVQSNDPLIPAVQIPVTMTVQPTQSMGWIEGTVTDLRKGDPLEATITAEGRTYTVVSNHQDGTYKFWLEPGVYDLHVSAPGYVEEIQMIHILSQEGITQDFALLLDAPWFQYSPESITSTQMVGEVNTHTLTILSEGSLPLEFSINESAPKGTVLNMHMNELEGSTEFIDVSGYENHGSCPGTSCPIAGVEGHHGTSLFFDGTNDYIVVPNTPSLNPQEAITFSAWIHPEDWKCNPRILQKGNHDNQYRFLCEGGVFKLELDGIGLITTDLPSTNTWHHVVGLYNGSVMQIWIDGELEVERVAAGSIITTSDPLHIGTKYSMAPECDYFHGIIDDVMILDRGLSPAEILALYHGGIGLEDWLSINPITGTLKANTSLPVGVTIDATGLSPGTYTTYIYISSNDPLVPSAIIPVTLTVWSPDYKLFSPIILNQSTP